MTLITQKIQNKKIPEDEELFTSLRARHWREFVGQDKVKKSLNIAISASNQRHEALDHILLYGPPGLGKTTLAHLIAKEMKVGIKTASGPIFTRVGDLAAILTNLNKHDILFIDEIHRINSTVEEMLYSAMEDYCLDIILGKGPLARTVKIDLPHFTIIGATTRTGLLSAPLRDRFGIVQRLNYYNHKDLSVILLQASKKMGLTTDNKSLQELAKRSRGTPRIGLKLLKRVRDIVQVKGYNLISIDAVSEALDLLEVDPMGLDEIDRKFLLTLIEKHNGGPVGVETLAATISEDVETVVEVLEPYLLQIGFLKRTSRGRMALPDAYTYFSIKLPAHINTHA